MSFMALEISVNGEHLYAVGTEGCRLLSAHIWGHRLTPDYFTRENWPEDEELPNADIQRIDLRSSVAVPDEEGAAASNTPDRNGHKFITESYKSKRLAVGDVVTLKGVETGVADEPNGPKLDPRFPGQTIILPDPDVE